MTKEEIIQMANQANLPYDYVGGELMWLDKLEKFAKLVTDKAYEEGFFAGFEASGEGFNGEYPYSDRCIDLKTDEYVLHALKEAREQK
jgi:hypothetical protein